MTSDQDFKVPSWAGVAPTGLHLDVVKNGSVLQKLLLDEKNCYIFGRAKESCDFPLPHQSCSRQHSALVYHKHLKRPFLIDLGSTHGTFIGSMRLEAHKPTQVPLDSTLSFGASTRTYVLRERPPVVLPLITSEGDEEGVEGGTLLGLPELDNDLDDLTQFNTAHNRQISMVGISEKDLSHKRKQHPLSISFADEEEIINPEDIDPTIGRFRNMVQTTIIPTKKRKLSDGEAHVVSPTSPGVKFNKFKQPLSSPTALYADTPSPSTPTLAGYSAGSTFFAKTISAAPPVANPTDLMVKAQQASKPIAAAMTWDSSQTDIAMPSLFSSDEHRKKKYAKESWPGKKPAHLLI